MFMHVTAHRGWGVGGGGFTDTVRESDRNLTAGEDSLAIRGTQTCDSIGPGFSVKRSTN